MDENKTLTEKELEKVDGGTNFVIKCEITYNCRNCGKTVHDNCENPERTKIRYCEDCYK
jgi:bacteriocin-like protein